MEPKILVIDDEPLLLETFKMYLPDSKKKLSYMSLPMQLFKSFANLLKAMPVPL